ncbi:MAG: DUF6192 family protein [Streptosporangiaceae bacterium]
MSIETAQQVTVGRVTGDRYEAIVARARELVESMTRSQFGIGDLALEIEPMNVHGVGEDLGVEASIRLFAEDIGLAFSTVNAYRWTASRWPAHARQAGVSFTVHRVLASIADEQERWARIKRPPKHERTGAFRWTEDGARREVGYKVDTPLSVPEKVRAIHDLTADEQVATKVATDLLHRPDIAFKAMADPTARQMVNRAQVDHAVQTIERQQADLAADQQRPELPVPVPRFERCMEFIDLVGACALFTSSVGRVMPTLRGHTFTSDERDAIRANLGRVRATADWIDHAVDTGNMSLDDGLAALLGDQ